MLYISHGEGIFTGVLARDPSYLPYIKAALTPEAVDQYMSHVFEDHSGPVSSRIQRYVINIVNWFTKQTVPIYFIVQLPLDSMIVALKDNLAY